MPADTLFGESTAALAGASNTATQANEQQQQQRELTSKQGIAAGEQVGETGRQGMRGQQAQDLAKLNAQIDQASNMMTITPQIALGLVKNTGEKDWLKAVGQKMRSDVVLGMYTHGIDQEYAKHEPRPVKRYVKNKEQTGIAWVDSNGVHQEWFGDPVDLDKLHPPKSGGKGGLPPGMADEKEFKKSYEKQSAIVSDATKFHRLQAQNPDEAKRLQDWVNTYRDKYDQIIKKEGSSATGGSTQTPTSTAGSPDSGVIDKDALFKDL